MPGRHHTSRPRGSDCCTPGSVLPTLRTSPSRERQAGRWPTASERERGLEGRRHRFPARKSRASLWTTYKLWPRLVRRACLPRAPKFLWAHTQLDPSGPLQHWRGSPALPPSELSCGGGAHLLRATRTAPRAPLPRARQGPPLPSATRVRGSRQYLTVSHRRIRLLPCRVHLQPQRLRVGKRERPRSEELLLGDEAQLHAVLPARRDPDGSGSVGHGASASTTSLSGAAASPRTAPCAQNPPREGEGLGSAAPSSPPPRVRSSSAGWGRPRPLAHPLVTAGARPPLPRGDPRHTGPRGSCAGGCSHPTGPWLRTHKFREHAKHLEAVGVWKQKGDTCCSLVPLGGRGRRFGNGRGPSFFWVATGSRAASGAPSAHVWTAVPSTELFTHWQGPGSSSQAAGKPGDSLATGWSRMITFISHHLTRNWKRISCWIVNHFARRESGGPGSLIPRLTPDSTSYLTYPVSSSVKAWRLQTVPNIVFSAEKLVFCCTGVRKRSSPSFEESAPQS